MFARGLSRPRHIPKMDKATLLRSKQVKAPIPPKNRSSAVSRPSGCPATRADEATIGEAGGSDDTALRRYVYSPAASECGAIAPYRSRSDMSQAIAPIVGAVLARSHAGVASEKSRCWMLVLPAGPAHRTERCAAAFRTNPMR